MILDFWNLNSIVIKNTKNKQILYYVRVCLLGDIFKKCCFVEECKIFNRSLRVKLLKKHRWLNAENFIHSMTLHNKMQNITRQALLQLHKIWDLMHETIHVLVLKYE